MPIQKSRGRRSQPPRQQKPKYERKHGKRSSFVPLDSEEALRAKFVHDEMDPLERTGTGAAYLVKTKHGKDRVWIRPEGFGRRADGSGPGVAKGFLPLATREVKDAIQQRGDELLERLFQIAFGQRDLLAALSALKTLMSYGYGRPTVLVEVTKSEPEVPKYVAELPPSVSHEEWLANMQKVYGSGVINVSPSSVTETTPSTNGVHHVNGNGSMNGNGPTNGNGQ